MVFTIFLLFISVKSTNIWEKESVTNNIIATQKRNPTKRLVPPYTDLQWYKHHLTENVFLLDYSVQKWSASGMFHLTERNDSEVYKLIILLPGIFCRKQASTPCDIQWAGVSKLCKCTKSLEPSCFTTARVLPKEALKMELLAAIGRQHSVTQLNLPISIFFLIALWPWYTNESMIPETVNTPAHQEDFIQF